MEPAGAIPGAEAASLEVIDPSGHRSRVALYPLPFNIGRSPESHLVLRDSRTRKTLIKEPIKILRQAWEGQ